MHRQLDRDLAAGRCGLVAERERNAVMHARSSSCRLAGACTALLALALLGTPAAAAKAASGSHPARVAGTVSAVDTTAGTVTITPKQAGAVTLGINSH